MKTKYNLNVFKYLLLTRIVFASGELRVSMEVPYCSGSYILELEVKESELSVSGIENALRTSSKLKSENKRFYTIVSDNDITADNRKVILNNIATLILEKYNQMSTKGAVPEIIIKPNDLEKIISSPRRIISLSYMGKEFILCGYTQQFYGFEGGRALTLFYQEDTRYRCTPPPIAIFVEEFFPQSTKNHIFLTIKDEQDLVLALKSEEDLVPYLRELQHKHITPELISTIEQNLPKFESRDARLKLKRIILEQHDYHRTDKKKFELNILGQNFRLCFSNSDNRLKGLCEMSQQFLNMLEKDHGLFKILVQGLRILAESIKEDGVIDLTKLGLFLFKFDLNDNGQTQTFYPIRILAESIKEDGVIDLTKLGLFKSLDAVNLNDNGQTQTFYPISVIGTTFYFYFTPKRQLKRLRTKEAISKMGVEPNEYHNERVIQRRNEVLSELMPYHNIPFNIGDQNFLLCFIKFSKTLKIANKISLQLLNILKEDKSLFELLVGVLSILAEPLPEGSSIDLKALGIFESLDAVNLNDNRQIQTLYPIRIIVTTFYLYFTPRQKLTLLSKDKITSKIKKELDEHNERYVSSLNVIQRRNEALHKLDPRIWSMINEYCYKPKTLYIPLNIGDQNFLLCFIQFSKTLKIADEMSLQLLKILKEDQSLFELLVGVLSILAEPLPEGSSIDLKALGIFESLDAVNLNDKGRIQTFYPVRVIGTTLYLFKLNESLKMLFKEQVALKIGTAHEAYKRMALQRLYEVLGTLDPRISTIITYYYNEAQAE